MVTYQKSHKTYHSEAHRTLKEQFYEQFYDWRNYNDATNVPLSAQNKIHSAVAKHISTTQHSLDDVKIQILKPNHKPPALNNTIEF